MNDIVEKKSIFASQVFSYVPTADDSMYRRC